MRRPRDWMRQAELDVSAARDMAAAGHYEWACFLAHQSGEKAVKALHESRGVEAWGDTIAGLLGGSRDVPTEIRDAAKALDRHYIPTRYPNTHPEGAPGDLYTARDADQALRDADGVLDHVRHRLS